MATSKVEDYLKRILLEQERAPDSPVSTGQIADRLDVTPGTATSMVKSLERSGWVRYTPYSGVRLSPSGLELATHVLRRHRLVESFLVRILGYSWSEVHVDAQRDHSDLTRCSKGRSWTVSRVLDQRPDFLRVLEEHGILPGREVSILERDAITGTVEISSPDQRPLRLGFTAAASILVLDACPVAGA